VSILPVIFDVVIVGLTVSKSLSTKQLLPACRSMSLFSFSPVTRHYCIGCFCCCRLELVITVKVAVTLVDIASVAGHGLLSPLSISLLPMSLCVIVACTGNWEIIAITSVTSVKDG